MANVRSSAGADLNFSLTYNSYNADGSHAQVDVGLGYGWTHSYNVFLFTQSSSHLFRMGPEGFVTKYRRTSSTTYVSTNGWFETIVRNPDSTFTLTQKDQTRFTFASIPNTPFLVGGPVYRLTLIVDRNNNATILSYHSGNLIRITDTYGRSLDLSYYPNRKLAAVVDPLTRTTTFQYDSTGRKLERITDPEGRSIQYGYNFLYQMSQKIDKDGRVFFFTYQSGKPVAVTDAFGNTLFTLANSSNWATDNNALGFQQMREYLPSSTFKTDGRGNVWRYDYDKNGYITRIVAPDGAITRYTYDTTTLHVSSMTDANNRTTSYTYDTRGNLTQMTNALGHVTAYTYDPVFNMVTSMTDPNGRVTTYQYDTQGNRIRETDPLGQTREWTYDARGNVLTEKDKRGGVTTYEYDLLGNRTKITDALGNVTRMTYDTVGNMLSRTDANNHTTTYVYDGLNRLNRTTDPLLNVTQYFYDGEGNQIGIIDRNGNTTSFDYDHRRRLIRTTDALGQTVTQTYDGNDNRVTMTDQNGHITRYVYDVQDRLVQVIDALNQTTTTTYDGVGNKLSDTDANGRTTTYEYDALNRLIQRTDPVTAPGGGACVTRFAYDTNGLPGFAPTLGSNLVVKQTDGNGKVTYFGYDALNRQVVEIRKEGDIAPTGDVSDAITRYAYDANDNRVSITEPNGNITTYEYDALNRLVKETNAAGDVTQTAYDGVGNVIAVMAPNGNITNNTYDANDRVVQVTDSEGGMVQYTYDAEGNHLTQTDGNGNTAQFGYDALYRLRQVIDPLNQTTQYDYDGVGNLVRVTDREGKVTTYAYDAVNRRVTTTDALGGVTRYEYDFVGNLTRIIDANNHDTRYEYDGLNRLVKETYADPAPNTRTYTYDCVGNILTRTDQKGQTTRYVYNDLYFLMQRDYPTSADDNFTYDLSGRMLTAEKGGWLVTFSYDGANRVTQTTQNGKTITYAYNIPGRTRTLTYPGGRTITEQMDFRSRLNQIDDGGASPLVRYTYDAGNRVLTRAYRNGTTATYGYNANNWMLSLEHTVGATRVAGFGYDYDQEGNKKFEEKRHQPLRSEAYQYDALYRLVDFKVGQLVGGTVPVPVTQTSYNLDAVGNWNSKTTDSVTETRTHNAVNEITSINGVPISHDDNGNLSEDERYRYDYDEENRLTRVTRKSDNQVVGTYQYDALSRRVVKVANPAGTPTETRYFYDGGRIIEEQNAGGATQATYVYGNYIDEVLTMDRGGQTYYYHQNALWSVAAVTDAAANAVERYSYDAYGCPTITDGTDTPVPPNAWGTPHSAIGNPYLFTGREHDEESGLYFYRARYYDCAKGRFLQRDPWRVVDGINLYEYVDNNPLAAVDPYGLLLVAIDGTGSRAWSKSPEFITVKGFKQSHVRNFYDDYRGTKAYFHGPDSAVLETILGGEAPRIHRGAYAWLCARWCKTEEDVDLVGHSRGGHIVLQIAIQLNTVGCCCNGQRKRPVPVRFLGLYDPVDMSAGYGGNYNIPPNVKTAVVLLANPRLGSRGSWTRAYRSSAAKRTIIGLIWGTHAAIGGAPWTGDHPSGTTESRDQLAAIVSDMIMRLAAKGAGVPIKPKGVEDYGYRPPAPPKPSRSWGWAAWKAGL